MRNDTAPTAEPLEPAEEIEGALGLPANFLAHKRASPDGPLFYRLGRRTVRYRRSDVRAWLDGCARRSRLSSALAESA
jgi:hypothetical protein